MAWQAASLLLGYPDEELRGRLDADPSGPPRELPERVGGPLRACVAQLRGDAADRAGGGLRRDLRQPAPAQPVPHLLRPRRHPQARDGAAAVQADLPRVRVRADRQPSCPTTCASSWSTPPRSTTSAGRQLILDHRAGLELLRISLAEAGSRWAGAVEAVTATLPPLRGDEWEAVRRLAAEGPPEEEVGLTPYATPAFDPGPARPDGPTPLPMPSFPGSAADGHLPLGDRPLPVPGDLRGRPLLALPLRQVRLDHPLLPALRGPAAADRVSPLFHFGMLGVVGGHVDRPAGPGVVDRRGRDQHRDLPRRRGRGRPARRRDGAGRAWPS